MSRRKTCLLEAGITGTKLSVPYCGVAVFHMKQDAYVWEVAQTPAEKDQHKLAAGYTAKKGAEGSRLVFSKSLLYKKCGHIHALANVPTCHSQETGPA